MISIYSFTKFQFIYNKRFYFYSHSNLFPKKGFSLFYWKSLLNVISLKMFNLILFIRNDFYLPLQQKEWIYTILFSRKFFNSNFIWKKDFYKLLKFVFLFSNLFTKQYSNLILFSKNLYYFYWNQHFYNFILLLKMYQLNFYLGQSDFTKKKFLVQ